MKKLFTTSLLLFIFISINAQKLTLGFRVAPNLSFTNVKEYNQSYPGVKQKGVGVRYSLGINDDYYFTKNIAIATGLWYTKKVVNLDMGDLYNPPFPYAKYVSQSRYNLNYLQIPITAKFLTNKIKRKFKLYGQIGILLDIKLKEKPRDTDLSYGANNYFHNTVLNYSYGNSGPPVFKKTGVNFYIGGGIEKSIGRHMSLFSSLSYSRLLKPMLTNFSDLSPTAGYVANTLKVKTTQVSLEFGIKFKVY